MTEHNLFYFPYAFANAQLSQLEVTAWQFDKLAIVDPFGARWQPSVWASVDWGESGGEDYRSVIRYM